MMIGAAIGIAIGIIFGFTRQIGIQKRNHS
jgi:hypothetical protein